MKNNNKSLKEKKVRERLKLLASLISKHNILYHQKDNPEITEKEKVRASAERLGIDTAGMDTSEIKNAMLDKLSNE